MTTLRENGLVRLSLKGCDEMQQEVIKELEKFVEKRLTNVHTALPGEIVNYDTQKGVAIVKPYAQLHLADGRVLDYPLITGVPIVQPQSGEDTVIAYPVKKGDGCLIIISEIALDYWLSSGATSSELRFDLTNGIAIVGLFRYPLLDVKEATKDDAIIIRKGHSKIKLTDKGINIYGNVTVDGSITAKGDITAAGKSVANHTHTDSDGGKTSKPI